VESSKFEIISYWQADELKEGAMKCPECGVLLNEFSIGDDVIKECHSCRGLWFEDEQLESVKDEVLPEMGWIDLDLDSLKEQFDFKARTDVLLCPKCRNVTLTKIQDQKTNTEFCTWTL
jgi:Zn-finger nucleic acid-binding protein